MDTSFTTGTASIQGLDAALKSMGLTVLRTPYKSPQANAVCERFNRHSAPRVFVL